MAQQGRAIAKLARPGAGAVLPRERLLAGLDAASNARVVWLTAPGGAGKTALVASWLDARARPALWLGLDAGDADPASLLYYFAQAGGQLGAIDRPAPARSAAGTIGVTARRYFERLFAAAAAPLVVVLDNYHALPTDADAHEVVDALFESVPPGGLVIVMSRCDPPPRLARWRATAEVRAIGWQDLQFTRAESDALAAALGVPRGAQRATIHELARGWAVGILLLSRAVAAGLALSGAPAESPHAVFDYFAAEVFEHAPRPVREFLVRTAFLPVVDGPLAGEVSGLPHAAALLANLHASHLFTERKHGPEPVYEYHPLFREFLQRRAAETYDPGTVRAWQRATVAALTRAGEAGPAAELAARIGDWAAVARIARDSGEALAAYGRYATLASWVESAPENARAAEPWLAYWLGRCRLARRIAGGRAALEQAFASFERRGDVEGAFASCAWMLRSSADATDAARWIAAAERLAAAHPRFDDPGIEARIIGRFLLVQHFPPHHALVARFAERAERLMHAVDGLADRMRLAAFALSVPAIHGDVRRLAAMVAQTKALAACEDGPPGDTAALLLFHGYCQLQFGDAAEAAATIARMERLAAASGSLDVFVSAWYLAYRAAILDGDLERARAWCLRLKEPGAWPQPLAAHIGTLNVYLALLEGHAAIAVAEARAVLDAAGTVLPEYRPLWQANLGQALLEQGETRAALRELDAAIDSARRRRCEGLLVPALLLRAAALARLGDDAGSDASLREGLAGARALGCVPFTPFIVPATFARLAVRALGRGIERDFVRVVVVRHRIAPPVAEEERWPWRVRVRALGGFAVEVDGAPLDGSARLQRKPLELMRYLIAAGGRDVGFGAVSQALWPDSEGDAAKRSFDVTLHRLRRLLGHDAAVSLQGGKLALHPALVWVDAFAFERLAGRLDRCEPEDEPAIEVLERALRLYRGPLLGSDEEPWAGPARERLRRRFVQLAERLGEHWERAADPEAAIAWYDRAIAVEPVAERLHQRVIRCLHAQGRFAEAIAAYRRCREALRLLLGVNPSPETEAIHRQLGAN